MKVGFYHAGETAHLQFAPALIASVRRWIPSVEIVQFTDTYTPQISGVDRLERLRVGPIALRCLEAYAAAESGDWLFVDTDVLIQQDVRSVFNGADWDIAVATREGTMKVEEVGCKFMTRQPYNKGAVFSRCPVFWREAAQRLGQMPLKSQAWMGDQICMNETIASGAYAVKVLDNRFNYPPRSADEDVSRKAILHYKGARKAWMKVAA